MIRLVSKATLLSAIGVLAAGSVMAGVPNATQSTITPTKILLVGYNGTSVDPGGGFTAKTITVRDAAMNPVANSVVVLNFNACHPSPGPGPAYGIRLSATQVGAGMTLNAGARTMSGVTNAAGQVVFRVCGSSFNSTPNGPEAANCVSVTADGVPLGTLSVATFDQNGDGDLNGSDLGLWQNDRSAYLANAANYRNRSDYNFVAGVDGADGGLLVNARFGTFGGHPGGGAQVGQIRPHIDVP